MWKIKKVQVAIEGFTKSIFVVYVDVDCLCVCLCVFVRARVGVYVVSTFLSEDVFECFLIC